MATSSLRPRFDPCPECYIGTLRVGRAYFCTTVAGQFVSAPDFPAWICDVCGRREYDPKTVRELEALVRTRVPFRRDPARTSQARASGGLLSEITRTRGAS